MEVSVVEEFEKSLCCEIKSLEHFLNLEPSDVDALAQVKACYDLVWTDFGQTSANEELLVEGFSFEQIWQQLKHSLNIATKVFDDAVTGLCQKRKRVSLLQLHAKKRRTEEDEEGERGAEEDEDNGKERNSVGKSIVDELLAKGLEEEEIWKQLKDASKNGDKTFEAAYSYLQKKHQAVNNASEDSEAEEMMKNDDAEEKDDEEPSDDEYLKEICVNWKINLRKKKNEEEEDYNEDEDEEDDEEEGEVEEDEDDEENENGKDKDSDNNEDSLCLSEDEYGIETLKKSLKKPRKQSGKSSQVDDTFFRLDDMNDYLDKMDQLANHNNANETEEDEVDYFKDSSEDEDEEKNAKYSDFFDAPEVDDQKGSGEEDDDEDNGEDSASEDATADESDESSDDDDDDDDDEKEDDSCKEMENKRKDRVTKTASGKDEQNDGEAPKSAFQKRQELLRKQITDVEESNLKERPWHLRGEVTAADRPENSLLTTHLDYKYNDASTIDDDDNDENTMTAEEILRRNYDSEAFVVNVTRKVKPVTSPFKYRKEVVLDQEKSKIGLAEIYEKEYLAQSEKEKEEEDEEYKENRKILDNLLCGLRMMFSDGPVSVLPPKLELKVLENVASVTVEEVAPLCISDASRLTAEEIQGKRKTELVGETERTKTDKNRARRKKKNLQHRLALEKKARAADPNSKEAKEEALKQLERKNKRGKHVTIHKADKKNKKSSSKDFFEKLQNQVTSSINKKKEAMKSKK